MDDSTIVLSDRIIRGIIQDNIDLLRSIHDVGGHECDSMIIGLQALLRQSTSLVDRELNEERSRLMLAVNRYLRKMFMYLSKSDAPDDDVRECMFNYVESSTILYWLGLPFDDGLIAIMEKYYPQIIERHNHSIADTPSAGEDDDTSSSEEEDDASTCNPVDDSDEVIKSEIEGLEREISRYKPNLNITPFSADKDYEAELAGLTGLDSVKRSLVEHITNYSILRERKQLHNDVNQRSSFNMIFKGRPGTGKTTVARLMAGMLKKGGISRSGHLVEVDATNLISPYIGASAKIAKYVALKAVDGILFIDEAYTLRGGKSSHSNVGAEVVDALTPILENYRDRLIVVLAGYNKEMDEMLAQVNTGFASRFTQSLTFEDYNAEEMLTIFMGMATRDYYQLDDECVATLLGVFDLLYRSRDKAKGFANARTVRTIYETVCTRASNRMAQNKLSGADLDRITIDDIRLTPQELRAAMGLL